MKFNTTKDEVEEELQTSLAMEKPTAAVAAVFVRDCQRGVFLSATETKRMVWWRRGDTITIGTKQHDWSDVAPEGIKHSLFSRQDWERLFPFRADSLPTRRVQRMLPTELRNMVLGTEEIQSMQRLRVHYCRSNGFRFLVTPRTMFRVSDKVDSVPSALESLGILLTTTAAEPKFKYSNHEDEAMARLVCEHWVLKSRMPHEISRAKAESASKPSQPAPSSVPSSTTGSLVKDEIDKILEGFKNGKE